MTRSCPRVAPLAGSAGGTPALPASGRRLSHSSVRWLLLALLLTPILLRDESGLTAARIRQATAPHAFRLIDWEVEHVAARLDEILAALAGRRPAAEESDAETIRRYFRTPVAARGSMQAEAEVAIQRLVADALRAEDLTALSPLAGGAEVVFPPVSFTFTEPPQVLIVSPRERIDVSHYVLLKPNLDASDITLIEDSVASRGLSTLVTPIGGLSTYPAMVMRGATAESSLSAVAHEWAHAYFFFYPLGRGYWSSQEVRTINETAAELVGDELGRRLASQLGLVAPPATPAPAPSSRQSEFSRLLRETRQEVDRLLALGQVDEAERYMEQRRLIITARGYPIRRLNQAYFAFHGSYAEGPAGSSPIAGQIRRLRIASPSLGAFVRAVAQVEGAAELERESGR